MNSGLLWAKLNPFQSVKTHGITSGIVAQTVYSRVLAKGNRELIQDVLGMDQSQMERFIGYLVSLHDIGKIEFAFQSNDPEMKKIITEENMGEAFISHNGIRHEKTSEKALLRIWKNQGMDKQSYKLFAGIVKVHHQGKTGEGRKGSEKWQQLQDSFEEEMRRTFWEENGRLPAFDKKNESSIAALLLGILILSDWIASGDTFSDAEAVLSKPNGIQILERRAQAFFVENDFIPKTVTWGAHFCDVWKNIPQEGRRPLQVEIEKLFADPKEKIQMLLIEAPMGEGKTEAGMYAALQMQRQWGKNGFYIALPTSATSNQMVQRMRALITMHDLADTVRLLHAMAWLVDEKTPERIQNAGEEELDARNWLTPLRRGLLAPYAVGTVDQAMLAVSVARYSVLRLLGLSNKVLIIDEVHSYDVYMGEFIKNLLQWCRVLEIPVVMLSATLPPEKRKELFDVYGCELPHGKYPCISAVTDREHGIVQNIPLSGRRYDFKICCANMLNSPEKIAKLAMNAVKDGGCICVLMNTVREAQMVYSQLQNASECQTLLFHAQFTAGRREEIEEECLRLFGKDKTNRPKQAILVATQVVEQSLDVDFDAMITAVAPMDLLLQRFGRVHRHSDTHRPNALQEPTVWILTPENIGQYGVSGIVYPKCLLRQSENLLLAHERVRIPEDMEALVSDGYDLSKAPAEELNGWFNMLADNAVRASQGRDYLLNPPDKEFSLFYKDPVFEDDQDNSFLSVKTRLGEPSVRIALLEPELFGKIRALTVVKNGVRYAPIADRELAQEVLKYSASVPERRIRAITSGLLDIKGDKLLIGVSILPVQDGAFHCEQYEIVNDRKLGVLIRETPQE